jgi:hypothetical protein
MSQFEQEKTELVQEKKAVEKHEKVKFDLAEMKSSVVKLDIGGTIYKTTVRTLKAVPDTYFHAIFAKGEDQVEKQDDGTIFIDRDGRHFFYILNYLRDNAEEAILPKDPIVKKEILKEAQFYNISSLIDTLSPL